MISPLPFPLFDGLSAQASLSLSTDGALDATHMAMARAHDLLHPLPPLPRIGAVTLKPAAILAIMAAVILAEAARKGAVMREDFLRHGLKPGDIDRHFGEALRRARLQQPGLFSAGECEAA